MKSPFVRFSQFVRTPLTIATLGLCSAWGCRHLPGTHRLSDRDEIVESFADDRELAEETGGYEEPLPPTSAIIDPRCTESPIVNIDEGRELFAPTPRLKDEPVPTKPVAPEKPLPTIAPKATVEPTVPTKKVAPPIKPEVKPADKPVKVVPNGKLDVPPEPESQKDKAEPPLKVEDVPAKKAKKPAKKAAAPVEAEDALEFDEPKSNEESETRPSEDARLNDFAEKLAESIESLKNAVTRQERLVQPIAPVDEFVGDEKPLIVPNTELPAKVEFSKVEASEVTPLFASKSPAPAEPVIEQSPVESAPVESESAALDNEVLSLDAHCDGLVFDSEGFGYVSHRDRIVKFSPSGESSVWASLKSPKGHRIEPEGTHLVCDTDRRAVVRLSFEGKVIGVAANECNGAPLRAPHEIAVDPRGGFYFTDPGYVQVKTPIGKLHYVDRLGKVSIVAAKIGFPTGVVYDPVRLRLFVVESQFGRVLEFKLSEPGKIDSHEVFAELPKLPDNEYHLAGLCLDGDGNLYVTQQQSKTVLVFDPQGRSAGKFPTGDVMPSSVALRSPDADELFFTGGQKDRARQGKVIRLNLGK